MAEIDISHEICPMTYVRTRLALDRLQPGEVLRVTIRGEEARLNVPRSAAEQGHTILSVEDGANGTTIVAIRRA